jgi:hypothetical protein
MDEIYAVLADEAGASENTPAGRRKYHAILQVQQALRGRTELPDLIEEVPHGLFLEVSRRDLFDYDLTVLWGLLTDVKLWTVGDKSYIQLKDENLKQMSRVLYSRQDQARQSFQLAYEDLPELPVWP